MATSSNENDRLAQMTFLANFGLMPKALSETILAQKKENLECEKIQTRSKRKWNSVAVSHINKIFVEQMTDSQQSKEHLTTEAESEKNLNEASKRNRSMILDMISSNTTGLDSNNMKANSQQHQFNEVPSARIEPNQEKLKTMVGIIL